MGLRKPKTNRLGVDYAGTVDAVGKNVTQFRPGDEVFGGRNGAYAEYVCAREERAIVPKPPSVTFEEAAAAPVAALTATTGPPRQEPRAGTEGLDQRRVGVAWARTRCRSPRRSAGT